jgi:PAS domain S-box-containing protein
MFETIQSPPSPAAEGRLALDRAGRLTYMNAAAARLLGWTEGELRGRDAQKLIHYRRPDGADGPSPGVFGEQRTVHSLEDTFVRRDGAILPVVCSSITQPGGIVIVFSDATEEIERRRDAQLDADSWIARIRESLDENRFELYSQPIVPLTGGAAREELLLRMITRDGYVVSPGAFLPSAEKFGLIAEIDRWVIAQAVRFAGVGRIVHVNLSGASIADPCLLDFVEDELRIVMAPASNIIFELVETTLMTNAAAGEAFAAGAHRLGCGLALDDFGTGPGSLTNLKRLPVQSLKIDIDFVRDLSSNEANQHLVRAIVDIARSFEYETIAEGVEDRQTLDLLRVYGVDYVQGYYLSHPAPQREAPPLLRSDARTNSVGDRARVLRERLLDSYEHGGDARP